MFIIAGGRKSKYHTHVKPRLDEVKAWRESGDSEKIISKKLGVAMSTFSEYKLKFPEFAEILQHSKVKLINNLKTALWKEAMGYDFVEDEKYIEKTPYNTKLKDEDGNPIFQIREKSKVRKVTKRARSQAQLLVFALCNLCPEEFKRVDKEAVNQLEEEMAERQNEITDKKINEAFNKLYEAAKEDKDDKNKETKKTEDS